MSEHTLGPWQMIATLRSHEFKIHKCSQRASEADFTHLATVRARPEGVAMTRANARLIAAAPDLLVALKSMVEFFSPYAGGSECNRADALQDACDAIAKAEGRK